MSEKHVSGPAGEAWIVEGGGVERPALAEHVEGETLGQYRARQGLSGTNTHAAMSIVWRNGGWADKDPTRANKRPAPSLLIRAAEMQGEPREERACHDALAAEERKARPNMAEDSDAPPAPSAELAALLPGLAADVATVRATFTRDVPTDRRIERIARAAELLAAEREQQAAIVNAIEADLARVRAAGAYSADARVAVLRARVAELEAERARPGWQWTCSCGWSGASEALGRSAALGSICPYCLAAIGLRGTPPAPTDPDRAALLAELGRQPVELLRAVAEVVALRVEDVPTSPRDVVEKALELIEAEWHTSFAGPGDEPLSGAAWFACARRMLARIARVALAGIQACAPAPGRPSVLTDANDDLLEHAVFGVSAQGGDITVASEKQSLLELDDALKRIRVRQDQDTGQDITKPIAWLLGAG